ncbi:DUF4091 domain-containing protein [Paenibacillus sp. OV219]|uniref:DUF4091 domain-containing protein n=1 Tax=Paenibacillus sp. OV219 TaxID=1884377 RepID=UPI0008B8B7A3|nr:DUF4091 domain-containing protein [Paenibacillus sp. OV219]SEO13129.1 protein of unknown function [Paenibacillus sp. OV219]
MTTTIPAFELRTISSLAKVFADEELSAPPHQQASALANETFAFQVAYRSKHLLKGIQVKVSSTLSDVISIRSVGLVPSELPVYEDHDEHVLRAVPGLFPDPLFEVDTKAGIIAFPSQWRAIWVTVDLGQKQSVAGSHTIELAFETERGELLGSAAFELDVLTAALPKQTLIHTEWFHTDCLATHFGVPVFSEKHWEIIEKYVRTAAKHGMNMILTPVFTPPLDTAVGGERPTVQLVDVNAADDGTYQFGFEKLGRWAQLCRRQGIEYFEISHLFTQWGAKHAPKIIATRSDGQEKQIFGWDTDASGDAYRSFIAQFLPALVDWIKQNNLQQSCYFHISDEPSIDHMESYSSASGMVSEILQEFPIIDALSDYAFYEKGLVKKPIPANNHIEPFIENGVAGLWTYYCCGQYKEVSNRFFSMPSARNRILGIQLYKFQIEGFLHWGYNFWYAQYSTKPIDPFRNTDANYAFVSGDAFLVYPSEDAPVESIRLEVFYEALQDLRALQLLEQLYGREYVLAGLEEGLEKPITFSEYPREAEWLLTKREWVNVQIQARITES